ncbi:MAG TPA: translocation/assembly module TamB domain-containing protein [Bacteroidales bacterium]|jgi:hypothetical protein|nr:translocation/assembly module TamB domain-containing protein [Bacteroidales bacterium]HPE22269.1 translocation/assembly module TamB domain-containing protein [Bacteroidales bacterium]HPQ62875.1 translocation/assembly module TamB domain-containing protein [Bacteroidales bacterium]
MAKIIKKIGRIFLIIAAVAVMVPAVLFLLLQIPGIQTFTVSRITRIISEQTGGDISIGRVNYSIWHEIVLDDILFNDLNGDTLLSARRLDLRLREIRPAQKLYRFGRVDIYEPDFRMVKDSAGVMNLTEYLRTLRSDRERDSIRNTDIRFADIDIIDGSFLLYDSSDTAGVIPGRVNFRNMHLERINTKIRDLHIIPDSVSMVIRGLGFSESGGFISKNLDMNFAVHNNSLYFREVNLISESGTISAEEVLLAARDSSSWKDFINEVRMDIRINDSDISTSDLAYFVQPLAGIKEEVSLSGRVSGTVAGLKGRDIRMDYKSSTRLRFDFDISGLPVLDDSFLYIDFNEMQTRASDIERFSVPGKKPLKLPQVIHDLGLISYNGNFTGFTTDFVSFGRLTTERGTFATDLSLKPDGRNTFGFRGSLRTSNVDLGYIARDEEMFGGLWMHAEIDGSTESFRRLTANITGVVDSVEINNYLYRNITVSGTYADNIWDGSVEVMEPNIEMNLMGRFDLEKSMPEFDFSLNLAHADLKTLNLIEKDSIFRASALVTANFRGNRTDNLEGNLRLINSTLENSNGKLSIYDFLVTSEIVAGEPLLQLRSDFADAEVRGRYSVEAIKNTVAVMLARLLPSRFGEPEDTKGEETPAAMFAIDVRAKRIDKLNDFLGTGLSIAEGTRLTGHLWSDRPEMIAGVKSDAITFSGIRLGQMTLTGSFAGAEMKAEMKVDTVLLPDRSELGNFILEAGSMNDTIDLGMRWDNMDGGRTFGELMASGFFSLNELNKPVMTIALLPSGFTVNQIPWNISPARIVIDSTNALFDNLLVSSRTRYIRLDGKLSGLPEERLTMSFEGLNISYLNNLVNRNQGQKENSQLMTFEGSMNGSITLSDVYNNLLFESDMKVEDFKLNENNYGLVSLTSEWDPRRRVAAIDISNNLEGRKMIDIKGSYAPSSRMTDLAVSASDLPLDIINPFVRAFASGLQGAGSGTVRLKGKPRELAITGSVMARDASMKIDFLQTRYSFSDSIRFTPDGITFRNIRITDEKGNEGSINGMLTHRSFKDLGVSFDINMDRMLVLNTRPKDSDSFYGTAYASGYAGIRGNDEKIVFNISARTAPNTEFYIPLNTSASVSDYPYISFVSTDEKDDREQVASDRNVFIRQEEGSKIELNFDLEVTPDAEVQLILDETSGGVIRGQGEGKLNISLSSRGDVRMSGNYVIDDGDYLFTLGNILNKRFAVEEGGTVSWNGPIEDASLNIRALYKTKAALSEIFGEEEFSELKVKLPVECILSLSGQLLNPAISFDINLPTADERTRELLRVAIDTEEELSRQFLYLLVMNSFYPDPSLYNAGSNIGTPIGQTGVPVSPNVGVTTTTEMLSNQLSNWLSQISNDFDIGFSYRPGSELTDQEVELALSTQLLNDMVTVNGNVDVRGNQSNTTASNISGEFTVEVRLTDMLRFKVFNRSNYNLYYQVHPYTQGVGVFYRRDFNTLKDLFIKPEEKSLRGNTEDEDEDEDEDEEEKQK